MGESLLVRSPRLVPRVDERDRSILLYMDSSTVETTSCWPATIHYSIKELRPCHAPGEEQPGPTVGKMMGFIVTDIIQGVNICGGKIR